MFEDPASVQWLVARFGAWVRHAQVAEAEEDSRALIVHPDFVHTLRNPSLYARGLKTRWGELPWELLLCILSHLDSSRELANFQLVNSACQYVVGVWMVAIVVCCSMKKVTRRGGRL